MTPEMANRIAVLNAKAAAGTALTRDEMREAIALLRETRANAATAARTTTHAKASGIAPKIDVAGALAGLAKLGEKK